MSRITLALIALGCANSASATPASEKRVLAVYDAMTSVSVKHCGQPSSSREITVCARRHADRWRDPFVYYAPGDPRGESLEGESKRMSADHPSACGIGAILKNCGSVGVTLKYTTDTNRIRWRPLAE